jgi:hypothetical protein
MPPSFSMIPYPTLQLCDSQRPKRLGVHSDSALLEQGKGRDIDITSSMSLAFVAFSCFRGNQTWLAFGSNRKNRMGIAPQAFLWHFNDRLNDLRSLHSFNGFTALFNINLWHVDIQQAVLHLNISKN